MEESKAQRAADVAAAADADANRVADAEPRFTKAQSVIPCDERWPVRTEYLQRVMERFAPAKKEEVLANLRSRLEAGGHSSSDKIIEPLQKEYRVDRAMKSTIMAELQGEIDETTPCVSFDLAETMQMANKKPCSLQHPSYCRTTWPSDRAKEIDDFNSALVRFAGSLKENERFRQLLCFESLPMPGLAKLRVFVSLSGGLLGTDAMLIFIGWRPEKGAEGPHPLALKPATCPLDIMLVQRPHNGGPYIYCGEALGHLLVEVSKGRYGPFRWNMFRADVEAIAKGRFRVVRLRDPMALDTLRPLDKGPGPQPSKKDALEKAKQDILKRLGEKGIQLADYRLDQISQQVQECYQGSESGSSESRFDTEDSMSSGSDSDDGGESGEEVSAKYLKTCAKVGVQKDTVVWLVLCCARFKLLRRFTSPRPFSG